MPLVISILFFGHNALKSPLEFIISQIEKKESELDGIQNSRFSLYLPMERITIHLKPVEASKYSNEKRLSRARVSGYECVEGYTVSFHVCIVNAYIGTFILYTRRSERVWCTFIYRKGRAGFLRTMANTAF